MKPTRQTKAAQREATMQALIDVARELFSEQGYATAATEEIVQRAGVTRGALYHHFGSKEGLFSAVVEAVQADIAARIEQATATTPDLWSQLLIGCRAFLEACGDPHIQRILLIDAPAVLGMAQWRQLDAEHGGSLLESILAELAAAGEIRPVSLAALLPLLNGALNEGALWIASMDDQTQALDAVMHTLETLLDGLRLASPKNT